MKKNNYTLIECIIVFTVSVVLLFLFQLHAAQQIKESKCLNSLRMIGQGIAAYCADYDNNLPQSINYSYPHTPRFPDTGKIGEIAQAWLVNLDYVPLNVMRDGCPEYPAKEPKFFDVCGYSYNVYLGRYDKDGLLGDPNPMWYKNFPAQKIDNIEDPDLKIIMADTVNYLWLPYIAKKDKNDWRHHGQSNFLHFDGSAVTYGQSEFVFDDKNEASFAQSEVESRLYPNRQ